MPTAPSPWHPSHAFPLCSLFSLPHVLLLLTLSSWLPLDARTFEVGPGRKLNSLAEVPWETLAAGDEVLIHWREEPYHEKWVLCCRGTPHQPIVIRGLPGPAGQLPRVDGRQATTRTLLAFPGENRSIIRVGTAYHAPDLMPGHIVIENLDISGARPPFAFESPTGPQPYLGMAAGIHVQKGEHILLRQVVLHDCGNGLLVSPLSREIRVEQCHLFDNGNEGSISEHNAYTESAGMLFEGNHLGPLRTGCLGNNLKDRSAGLVIRYNWIEGGSRQLDLVDATGNPAINADARYQDTWVYGNVLLEPEGAGSSQIVHFGGDSGQKSAYRHGTLHFHHNTVLSFRAGATTVFRLSSGTASVDCRNNLFHVTTRQGRLAWMNTQGHLVLGRNWMTRGWVKSVSSFEGTWEDQDKTLSGTDPGFRDLATGDFELTATSPCQGTALPLEGPAEHPMQQRYRRHQALELLKLEATRPRNLGAQ